jgi:hypothetical protein
MPLFQFLYFFVPLFFPGGSFMVSQNFVVGEALVKFAGGTAANAAVEKSLQTAPQDLATLNQALEAIRAEVRIPFKAIRIASGAWVQLKLEADQVVQQAVEKLCAYDEFESVTLVPMESNTHNLGTRLKAARVELAPDNPAAESGDPRQLTSQLAAGLGLPLIGSIREKNQLLIEIDWKELTLALVERLKAIRDVEAAQPNYVLGIRPPS